MKKNRFMVIGVYLMLIVAGCANRCAYRQYLDLPDLGGPPGECGKLAGQVVAKETDQPICGAMVYVSGVPITVTDERGEYVIIGVKKGQYRVRFKANGYEDFNAPAAIVYVDLTTMVDAKLIRR